MKSYKSMIVEVDGKEVRIERAKIEQAIIDGAKFEFGLQFFFALSTTDPVADTGCHRECAARIAIWELYGKNRWLHIDGVISDREYVGRVLEDETDVTGKLAIRVTECVE